MKNAFTLREDLFLDTSFALERLALSDHEAFGLDPNLTVVEQVPLVIQQRNELPLNRVGKGM